MPHYMQRWTWLNKAMEEVKVELTVKKKKQDIRVCSGQSWTVLVKKQNLSTDTRTVLVKK